MRISSLQRAATILGLATCISCGSPPPSPPGRIELPLPVAATARGPLRRLETNPRYFTDGSGRAILLVGSHTWDNRQDIGPAAFDWNDYLAHLQRYNHNFVRLWVWEQPKGLTTWPDPVEPDVTLRPEIWVRTGPGNAADGGLKFDLSKFNQPFFDRLRQRVLDARDRGIYVSVMLFNGWSIEQKAGGGNPWLDHPFNARNNINGIDGDPNHDQRGAETHTLDLPEVRLLQEQYVRKVVDSVNDLDNVLYETSNESNTDSRQWQYYIIQYVKSYESTKRWQHPVGMSSHHPNGSNTTLFSSPADWIAPNGGDASEYRMDPPAADGSKVIIADTDHLWGIGGTPAWAWMSFTRGMNVTYMDPWYGRVIPIGGNEALRRAMGNIRALAVKAPLADMKPMPELASSGFCLAKPDAIYVTYVQGYNEWLRPKRILGRVVSWLMPVHVDLDLAAAHGTLNVEWMNADTGEIVRGAPVEGGRRVRFSAPFLGGAVLYVAKGSSGLSSDLLDSRVR